MELTILERLLILGALPPEGNVVTLRIVRDLKRNLSFTEEEIKENDIREEDKGEGKVFTQWKNDYYIKDIPIGEKAFDVIAESFSRMDKQKKLTEQHIPLYERFVEKKEK